MIKIEEAEYFLDKIKNAKRREDFIPNLSAFLASSRSIADYLLEDYNLKFGLQISLNDKLYPSTFEKIAKKKNNQIALKFIAYYNTEFKKLEVDAIGGLLLNKRNIKVHRTDVPLLADFSANITETVNVHDSVAIEVRDKYGNLKTNSSTTGQDPHFGLKKSGDSSISAGTSDQDQNVADKGSKKNQSEK